MDSSSNRQEDDADVDLETLRDVLDRHPVEIAVLFGSTVRGDSHAGSDVDLAVAFDSTVDDVGSARLSLLTDLTLALERDDIDLGLLDDLEPRVGVSALEEGIVLRGSQKRIDRHRRRLERRHDDGDERSQRDRFDAVIDRVDDVLGTG